MVSHCVTLCNQLDKTQTGSWCSDSRIMLWKDTPVTAEQYHKYKYGKPGAAYWNIEQKPHIVSHYKFYESPTWTACRSRLLCSLTSSNGHRLDSMRRWARMSFSSLLGGLPEAGGDTGGNAAGGMGLMASTFLMTTWCMFSMASVLERASRLPSPSHLPKDSCSCTSILM